MAFRWIRPVKVIPDLVLSKIIAPALSRLGPLVLNQNGKTFSVI